MKHRLLLPLLYLILPITCLAQHKQWDASEIKLKLNKLNFLGTVLYVAAHPDDENTRIISYLSNGRLATTGYLSMTRGDGGQNLIGSELRDQLGVIRTQELLAARRIDGGQQFFTRANDFGFSKSPEETFNIWGKQEILHDVIKVFREFQPDVIITRFPTDGRGGHGHHTASAMLAQEAFDKAADSNIFPELTKAYGVSKPKRLFTNTGRWWNQTITEDTPGIVVMDVGGYSPLLGESYTEMAADSRSQHKSQGFGVSGSRGREVEFLEFEKGDKCEKDIFDGVNTTWSRVKGSKKVQQLIDKAIQEYSLENPGGSLPLLIQIKIAIEELDNNIWKERKLKEVRELIAACTGLFIEATLEKYWVTPNDAVKINLELVNRSDNSILIEKIQSIGLGYDTVVHLPLLYNKPLIIKTTNEVKELPYSGPYWLSEPHSLGLFTVKNESLIGKPENDPALSVIIQAVVAGERIQFTRPVIYKWTDPVKGELYRQVEIVPPVFINIAQGVSIFSDDQPRNVAVKIVSTSDHGITGDLKLTLPDGWKSTPSNVSFTLEGIDQSKEYIFSITPPSNESTGEIKALATIDGKNYHLSVQIINYDHIPTQTLMPEASAQVVRIDLKGNHARIGYIKGAGDDIPNALRNMGYTVWEMADDEVNAKNLSGLDAVVLGIRALNTNENIESFMPDVLSYVKEGGTLVVQYNTNFRLKTENFSPYTLSLSRSRVTEEDAEVRILAPQHPVLNFPNKISQHDFNGWVQERGLYFPDKWATEYTPILSMNDKGEPPLEGSLLVAPYGKGYYVYTGLSFFRELPEGVPGAYKLLSNIVSLSKPHPASASGR